MSPPTPLPVTNTGLGPVPPVKKTGAFALPLTVMASVSLPLPWSVVRRLAALPVTLKLSLPARAFTVRVSMLL